MMIPDDLAERWHITGWALSSRAWALHIALATTPAPACFDMARRYETTLHAIADSRTFGQPAPATKKKAKKVKQKEQMELW